ncbi:MAG: GNAT family N-acetyltransferase [Chloroflexota bacterium]
MPNPLRPLPIEIRVMTPPFADQLDALQKAIFPTLTDDELFSADNYRKHMEIFPDGQYMAVVRHPKHGPLVIGACSAIRTTFDFDHIQHTFAELTDNGWLTTHEPDGDWLYGIDMSVHPKFRRRRVATRLYRVRLNITRRLNLRGEIIGGMMPGYDKHRKKYSIEAYVDEVAKGKLIDPTLTAQMKQGFEVRGILYDHITDPRADNCAALMVRENPDYVETS